jgi:hypothetical protein
MKNTVRREDVIDFLLKSRHSLSKYPEHAETCRQILVIVEFLKSHDIKFDDYGTTCSKKITSRDLTNLLIWAKIIKKLFDLISGDDSTF